MSRRASINPEVLELGTDKKREILGKDEEKSRGNSRSASPISVSSDRTRSDLGQRTKSDDYLDALRTPSHGGRIGSQVAIPDIRRLSLINQSLSPGPSSRKRGSVTQIEKLRQSLGGSLEEAYPADFVRAPTYAMKILVDLSPPLKNPIVLNVVRASTVNAVTRNVLKKYAAALNLDMAQLPLISNTAFFGPPLPWIPNPLPLQKQDVMKDRLMELRIPFPFIVTVSLDPVYVEKMKVEEEERKKQMEIDAARKLIMEQLMVKLFEIELQEFERREVLERRWLIGVEPAVGSILKLVEAEFKLVVMLQTMKEEEQRREAINDKIFFETLRRRNEELLRAQANATNRYRQSHVEKVQSTLIKKWEAQYNKITFVESAVRARLQYTISEQLQRGIIIWMAETEMTVLLGIHEEQCDRRSLIEKEIRAYNQWKDAETEGRLAIVAAQYHIHQRIQKERHANTLKIVLNPILNSNVEEQIDQFMKIKPRSLQSTLSLAAPPVASQEQLKATGTIQNYFSPKSKTMGGYPGEESFKSEVYGPTFGATMSDLWDIRQHVSCNEIARWENDFGIAMASSAAKQSLQPKRTLPRNLSRSSNIGQRAQSPTKTQRPPNHDPKVSAAEPSKNLSLTRSGSSLPSLLQVAAAPLPTATNSSATASFKHVPSSHSIPIYYSSITSTKKVASNVAISPLLYPYTNLVKPDTTTTFPAMGLSLNPLCFSQKLNADVAGSTVPVGNA